MKRASLLLIAAVACGSGTTAPVESWGPATHDRTSAADRIGPLQPARPAARASRADRVRPPKRPPTKPAKVRDYPPSAVVAIIRTAARQAGISENGLLALAWCESRHNPNADSGCCKGLLQQHRRYWPQRAAAYGFAGASPFDPTANATVSALMIRDGQLSHWSCAPAYRSAA